MGTATRANGHQVVSLAELLELPVPSQDVDLPEYGKSVTLFSITGAQRLELMSKAQDEMSGEQRVAFQHEMVAAALGGGTTPDQVAGMVGTAIDRLTVVAMRLNGMGDDAVNEAEAALKTTPSGDSG